MTRIPSSGPIGPIRLHQDLLLPLLGRGCRFTPRCSADAWMVSEGVVRSNNSRGQGYKRLQSEL